MIVLSLLSRIKLTLNAFLKKFGYEIRRNVQLEPEEMEIKDDKNLLTRSFTRIPGMKDIDLPYAYEYFAWYYPNAEMQSKKWVVDNVKDNWGIIDVGANIGYYSILFSKLAASGLVYAIEPTDTFDLLTKNLDFNSCNNVKTFNVGIASTTEVDTKQIYKLWGEPSELVETTYYTLDDFVEAFSVKKVDLLKIDTDGYDLEILLGAKRTIEKFNPYIMIEFSYALNTRGFEVAQLVEELIKIGYSEGLLLDHNNLVVKLSDNLMNRWSGKFTILPNEYSLIENTRSGKMDNQTKTLNRLTKKIQKITISQYEETFLPNQINKSRFTDLNPRLPGLGPKMEINDAPILKKIYRKFNPLEHLEFGTWEGFGTALVCENSDANVTTINLLEGESASDQKSKKIYTSSNYPFLREKILGVEQTKISDAWESVGWIYKYLGYEKRVTQILDSSSNLRVSDFKKKFDTIFIDGGHSKLDVINDTKLSIKLLNDNGIIIWHDFTLNEEELFNYNSPQGVLEGIDECLDQIIDSGIELYWIENTWLLVGHKT